MQTNIEDKFDDRRNWNKDKLLMILFTNELTGKQLQHKPQMYGQCCNLKQQKNDPKPSDDQQELEDLPQYKVTKSKVLYFYAQHKPCIIISYKV